MGELILYAYIFRSRAERVLWTLRELKLPHRVVRLDPFKGETRTAEFLKLNPTAKIPVLLHGDRVFTESLAIMEYLNDLSETKHLVPRGANANYEFRRVLHYGLTEIEPYLWVADQTSRLKQLYHWPEGTLEDALTQVRKHIVAVWSWADTAKFIAGEAFSLADIYFYQVITWAQKQGVTPPEGVLGYLERLASRAAFPPEMRSAS